MTSTFGSLNIAKTGLQYQQVSIDVANNNIANVNTDSYVRRRAVGAEIGATSNATMWSTYTGHGDGVITQGVQRLTDILLDKRVRAEHANLSYLQVQQSSMERLEAAINEPSDNGVAAALNSFASAWQDVVSAPDGSAARQSVIADGQTLAAAIHSQATAIDNEYEEQRAGALQDVSEINAMAQQMAQLNHSILLASANGADTGALQDQRDALALSLANKAGAVTTADAATGKYNVTITDANGNKVDLVKGDNYATLVTTGINSDATGNDPDGDGIPDPVSFAVTSLVNYKLSTDPSTATTTVTPGGDLGGVQVLLNVTLANYRQQLNDLATNIATIVNAQHQAGYDQNGVAGEAFFVLGSNPASSISVNANVAGDPSKVAASTTGVGTGDNDATNADRISRVLTGGPLLDAAGNPFTVTDATTGNTVSSLNVSGQYQRMVSSLGSAVAGLNTQTTNQQLLTSQVDDQREQTAGVSLDEETINLMQAQRAYQASSRVLSVMDSILDTLINHTGA